MALQPVKRKYSFSDGTLAERGDSLCAFAERDLAEMTNYGYAQLRINLIKGKIVTFKAFSPDEYYTSQMSEATDAKNLAIDNMSEVAEGVVRRAENKFKKGSAQARGFGWEGFITKADADKMVSCRLVHKMGTDKLAELTTEGLTAAILTDLAAKIIVSDNAITLKHTRVSERDIAVNDRIELGNGLYADLVSLADIGKHIWEDVNEAKYNDYVIYTGETSLQTVVGTVAVSTIHQPSVTVNSVGDELEITLTTGKVIAYFSDDPTNAPAQGQTTFEITPATPYIGTAAGLDWSSTNFRLLLRNEDPAVVADFKVVVKG